MPFEESPLGGHVYLSESQEISEIISFEDHSSLGEYSGSNRLLNAFTLSLKKNLSEIDLSELKIIAAQIMNILEILHKNNQPYNLLIKNSIVHIIPR